MKIDDRGSVILHRRNGLCGCNGVEGRQANEKSEEEVGNDRRNASLVVYFQLKIMPCFDFSTTTGTAVAEI